MRPYFVAIYNIDLVKMVVNKLQIGDTCTVSSFRDQYEIAFNCVAPLGTFTEESRLLILAGYLQHTTKPGTYLIIDHIPKHMTRSDLIKMSTDELAIEEEFDELISTQVEGSHYTDCRLQPIGLIMKCDLSYIQGDIINNVIKYKHYKDRKYIRKIKQIAGFAIVYKHKKTTHKHFDKSIFNFCIENKLIKVQSHLVRLATMNKWEDIVTECNNILST